MLTSWKARFMPETPVVDDDPQRAAVTAPGEGRATVVETTELRWFATGGLPIEVTSWFTRNGTVGVPEDRTDTYRIGGRSDVGLKRRSGEMLELKIRQSVGQRLELGTGLAGRVETWRKWSPAPSVHDNDVSLPWIDVRKRIIKRLFSLRGEETTFSPQAVARLPAGCAWSSCDLGRRRPCVDVCRRSIRARRDAPRSDPHQLAGTEQECSGPEAVDVTSHCCQQLSGVARPPHVAARDLSAAVAGRFLAGYR